MVDKDIIVNALIALFLATMFYNKLMLNVRERLKHLYTEEILDDRRLLTELDACVRKIGVLNLR